VATQVFFDQPEPMCDLKHELYALFVSRPVSNAWTERRGKVRPSHIAAELTSR
jgi:hypothetical protein